MCRLWSRERLAEHLAGIRGVVVAGFGERPSPSLSTTLIFLWREKKTEEEEEEEEEE